MQCTVVEITSYVGNLQKKHGAKAPIEQTRGKSKDSRWRGRDCLTTASGTFGMSAYSPSDDCCLLFSCVLEAIVSTLRHIVFTMQLWKLFLKIIPYVGNLQKKYGAKAPIETRGRRKNSRWRGRGRDCLTMMGKWHFWCCTDANDTESSGGNRCVDSIPAVTRRHRNNCF